MCLTIVSSHESKHPDDCSHDDDGPQAVPRRPGAAQLAALPLLPSLRRTDLPVGNHR